MDILYYKATTIELSTLKLRRSFSFTIPAMTTNFLIFAYKRNFLKFLNLILPTLASSIEWKILKQFHRFKFDVHQFVKWLFFLVKSIIISSLSITTSHTHSRCYRAVITRLTFNRVCFTTFPCIQFQIILFFWCVIVINVFFFSFPKSWISKWMMKSINKIFILCSFDPEKIVCCAVHCTYFDERVLSLFGN